MSTSIYSGIKINLTIHALNTLVNVIRKETHIKTVELKSAWFSEQVSQELDLCFARKQECNFDAAFKAARNKWQEEQADIKKGHRHPNSDFEFKLAVYPYKNKLYGRYFCEQKELINLLIEKPNIEEYHYQNSTDRSDNISASAWRQREKIWDGIFKDSTNYGFVADLQDRWADSLYDLDSKKIRTELPDMKIRAKYVANILVANSYPREQFLDSKGEFSFGKYMEFERSDEFRAKHAEETERLMTILPSAY